MLSSKLWTSIPATFGMGRTPYTCPHCHEANKQLEPEYTLFPPHGWPARAALSCHCQP